MKFSIIIPLYNSDIYIDDCLTSIKNQTYVNFEVIIIDDGSTDDSYNRAYKYIEDDSRFQLYKKENEGPLIARVEGFEKSTGEYIYFVDSDDYLETNLLEEVYKAIKETNSDMLMIKNGIIDSHNNMRKTTESQNLLKVDKDVILKRFLGKNRYNPLWSKIFKKTLLEVSEIKPHLSKELIKSNDRLQSFFIIKNSSNVYELNKTLYYYRINLEGLTFSYPSRSFHSSLKIENIIGLLIVEYELSKFKSDFYNNFVFRSLGNYMRYITHNKVDKQDKKEKLFDISNSQVFKSSYKHLTFKNRLFWKLIKNQHTFIIDVINVFNKRRLSKQRKGNL